MKSIRRGSKCTEIEFSSRAGRWASRQIVGISVPQSWVASESRASVLGHFPTHKLCAVCSRFSRICGSLFANDESRRRSMKAVLVVLLSMMVAVPALAGAPANGTYTSTDIGGSMLPGRYSESWFPTKLTQQQHAQREVVGWCHARWAVVVVLPVDHRRSDAPVQQRQRRRQRHQDLARDLHGWLLLDRWRRPVGGRRCFVSREHQHVGRHHHRDVFQLQSKSERFAITTPRRISSATTRSA